MAYYYTVPINGIGLDDRDPGQRAIDAGLGVRHTGTYSYHDVGDDNIRRLFEPIRYLIPDKTLRYDILAKRGRIGI